MGAGLLLAIVFGHVVCEPVHLGLPALPQRLVELDPEVLERLFLRLPQSQGVLDRRTGGP